MSETITFDRAIFENALYTFVGAALIASESGKLEPELKRFRAALDEAETQPVPAPPQP